MPRFSEFARVIERPGGGGGLERGAVVDLAKSLLVTTQLAMPEIAAGSGFSNATLLGIAFRRETGLKPSEYRRRFRAAAGEVDDGSQF